MRVPIKLFLIFGLITIHRLYAVSTGQDIVIAPFKEAYVVDINESEELFENCPVYHLDDPRQVLLHNGWKGNGDFSAQSKVFLEFQFYFFPI